MIAPDVRYNETKGVFPSFRLFGYPTRTRRYSVLLGKSTTRDENYEIEFCDRGSLGRTGLRARQVPLRARFDRALLRVRQRHRRRRPTSRTTPGEDLYARRGAGLLDPAAGEPLVSDADPALQRAARPGRLAMPFIGDRVPGAPDGKGIESDGRTGSIGCRSRYDTRDSIDMPTEGTFANAYVDGADRHVGSHDVVRHVRASSGATSSRSAASSRTRSSPRARFVDYMQGGTDTPFWPTEQPRRPPRAARLRRRPLHRLQPLLVSAELRTRVYERHLFGVNGELELAPFVEAGQVFRHIYDSPVSDLHVVGGLGFRGWCARRSSASSTSATDRRATRSSRGSTTRSR